MNDEEFGKLTSDVTHIKESVTKIETYVLGNNGEGLMRKVKGLATQVKAQWVAIGLIISGVGWIFKILLEMPK